jgi:hypothetical protein
MMALRCVRVISTAASTPRHIVTEHSHLDITIGQNTWIQGMAADIIR